MRYLKSGIITILLLGMFWFLIGAIYTQGRTIDGLKAETLKLEVKLIDRDVQIDELKHIVKKYIDEDEKQQRLAGSPYIDLPSLPGINGWEIPGKDK